jgi:hypothetical protein
MGRVLFGESEAACARATRSQLHARRAFLHHTATSRCSLIAPAPTRYLLRAINPKKPPAIMAPVSVTSFSPHLGSLSPHHLLSRRRLHVQEYYPYRYTSHNEYLLPCCYLSCPQRWSNLNAMLSRSFNAFLHHPSPVHS